MEKWAVRLVVLQTAAANLGSMLTPMGNPQNLYLYAVSGMGFFEFCLLMLPYVLLSGGCLALMAALGGKERPLLKWTFPLSWEAGKTLVFCSLGFAICLLGIFNILPPVAIAAAVAVFLIFADREVLVGVDYSLLGTFIAFFIFIGNLGCIEGFRNFLAELLAGHVRLVAVLASQIMSNDAGGSFY